jgi:hypothetical protein
MTVQPWRGGYTGPISQTNPLIYPPQTLFNAAPTAIALLTAKPEMTSPLSAILPGGPGCNPGMYPRGYPAPIEEEANGT